MAVMLLYDNKINGSPGSQFNKLSLEKKYVCVYIVNELKEVNVASQSNME